MLIGGDFAQTYPVGEPTSRNRPLESSLQRRTIPWGEPSEMWGEPVQLGVIPWENRLNN